MVELRWVRNWPVSLADHDEQKLDHVRPPRLVLTAGKFSDNLFVLDYTLEIIYHSIDITKVGRQTVPRRNSFISNTWGH